MAKKRLKYPDPNALVAPYFICEACADERGGQLRARCCTMSEVTCDYCQGEKQAGANYCTPVRDYSWPSQRKRDAARTNK